MSSNNMKCHKKYVYPLFSDPNSSLTFKWNLGQFWYLPGTITKSPGVFLFANLLIAKGGVLFMFLFFQGNLYLVEHPLNWNIPFLFTPPTLFLSFLILWRNHGLPACWKPWGNQWQYWAWGWDSLRSGISNKPRVYWRWLEMKTLCLLFFPRLNKIRTVWTAAPQFCGSNKTNPPSGCEPQDPIYSQGC